MTWEIADARDKAKKLRRAVDDGVYVAMEKQKRKQEALAAITVDKLAAEYCKKMEKGMTMKDRHAPSYLEAAQIDLRTPCLTLDWLV